MKFVIYPKPPYPEIFLGTFELSAVERNLERMFAVESSFNEDAHVSDYDKHKIKDSEKTIEFKDNFYYVLLLWRENKTDLAPSNYQTALRNYAFSGDEQGL